MPLNVWKAVNDRLGTLFNESDYNDWLDSGENYDEFEKAVLKILTPTEFDRADVAARVDALLQFKLRIGPQHVGGIDLNSLLDGKE